MEPDSEYSAVKEFIKYSDVTCIKTTPLSQSINVGDSDEKSISMNCYIVINLNTSIYIMNH